MPSMPNEQLAASLVSLFFSFKGRINRARFWIGTIPLVVGWIAATALFNWMSMRAESLVPVYGFGIAAGVMLLWGQLGVCIKRLHDRGKCGWWLLIFWALPAAVSQAGEASTDFNLRIAAAVAIGVIWLWAVLELGCLGGTEGPNAYGPSRCRRGADARLSLSYSDVMLAGR